MSVPRRLVVSIDDQILTVLEGGICIREFPVSTAAKGMGYAKDSLRTPTGAFRICEKIGAGQPAGTIFKARVPVGVWRPGDAPEDDLVLTRILRLDGLDADNANTLERCIYIHGTNREDRIGEPSSHGCVRLRNDDMLELFDMISVDNPVEILPATRRRGGLLFIASESVLTTLDGTHELARCRGDEAYRRVLETTTAAREGRLAPGTAFLHCMEIIRPDRAMCGEVAARCAAAMAPGAREFLDAAGSGGWLPVFLSGGPAPLAEILAKDLGIEHTEAIPLYFHDDGSYAGSAAGYPVTGSFSMAGVIRDWERAMLPGRLAMAGDALRQREAGHLVDAFISSGACLIDQLRGAL